MFTFRIKLRLDRIEERKMNKTTIVMKLKEINLMERIKTFTLRSINLHELIASQLIVIVTRSDTGSQNRLDLIQSCVQTHYACNGLVLVRQLKMYLILDNNKYYCMLSLCCVT
jgi:hypothetical protein